MTNSVIALHALEAASTYRSRVRIYLQGIGEAITAPQSRPYQPNATGPVSEAVIAPYDLDPAAVETMWTKAKNHRRIELINRKFAGGLTSEELTELAQLQAEMSRHRQRVAPLPIRDAERLYKELTDSASQARTRK